MNWSAYSDYKGTDIRWLDLVPSTWSIEKFRYCFQESSEKNGHTPVGEMLSVSGYRGIEIKKYDDENRKRTAEELEDYRVVRVGQLAVNTMWLNYAGLGVSEFEGHISPAYRAYWISPKFDPRFVHHLMRSSAYVDGYTALLTGIRPNSLQMSRDDLMAFPVLFPPIEDQQSIARFLDGETAKIDELIAKQEQLITTLREDRAATITQAVTKGLDPNVKMKDSGVDWVGNVPSNWTMEKGTWIGVPFGSQPVSEGEVQQVGEVAFLKVSSLAKDGLDPIEPEWFVPRSYRSEKNFLAFPKRGAAIFTNKVNFIDFPAVIDPNIMGWKMLAGNNPQFYGLILSLLKLEEIADVSSVPQLNSKHIARLQMPRPPIEEQALIVDSLRVRCDKIDTLIARSTEVIETLREYRSALITDAVTGKIDVREVA